VSPWPELAAVFPGVVVHGSGPWLQGRSKTAERLLVLEGATLGTTLVSGFLLFQTGASRYVVGPLALTSVAGVAGFGLSFAANLYATWAPPEGFGQPARSLPWLESQVGYLYVRDPQFSFRHLLTTSVDARPGPWHVAFASAHAPAQENQRFDLELGYRLFGTTGERSARALELLPDGSYLELQTSGARHRFDADGFVSHVWGLEVLGRLDTRHYLPDVHGAFFQVGAGWAKQWFSFELPGVDATTDTSLLLAHMGFGVYLGNRSSGSDTSASSPAPPTGGEIELYYDHRHDGFANGLKLRGLGSGPAGHLGLRSTYMLSPHFGLSARSEFGSAWTFGLNAVIRAGLQ
jgi:hypothetical protein